MGDADLWLGFEAFRPELGSGDDLDAAVELKNSGNNWTVFRAFVLAGLGCWIGFPSDRVDGKTNSNNSY